MIKLSKIFLIMFIVLLNINQIYSQVQQEWISRYNGTGNGTDEARAIVVDKDGFVYITGPSEGPGAISDYATIKYNSSGNQLWAARYNGPGNGTDFSNAITVDDSGNIYITGESRGNNTGVDYATIKYNSSGKQQWEARFTSPGNHRDAAYSIGVDVSGNVYVTGESYNTLTIDYVTIKYNCHGVQQWIMRYTDGIAYSIEVDDSGNTVVTGTSFGDFATVKYDTFGSEQWTARYDGPMNEDDAALAIALDDSGNVYVCGGSMGALHYRDYATIKYNSSGVEQWVRRYAGTANFEDVAKDITVDKSRNIYVTGYSTETGHGYDATTIKYNLNGDRIWLAHYHNGLNDFGKAIAVDAIGNVCVTGESDGNGTAYDYAAIKYDYNGIQKWGMRYTSNGDTDDVSYAIAVDNSGNVFVTGYSGMDMLTLKYSQPTEVNILSPEMPSRFELTQNYPNPFNPITKINYELPASPAGGRFTNYVSLIVYNALGNEVAALVNQKQNAGSYNVEFDGSKYPSGVYFYRMMIDGNVIDTKKMLLLK